jgi:hypothetical protein
MILHSPSSTLPLPHPSQGRRQKLGPGHLHGLTLFDGLVRRLRDLGYCQRKMRQFIPFATVADHTEESGIRRIFLDAFGNLHRLIVDQDGLNGPLMEMKDDASFTAMDRNAFIVHLGITECIQGPIGPALEPDARDQIYIYILTGIIKKAVTSSGSRPVIHSVEATRWLPVSRNMPPPDNSGTKRHPLTPPQFWVT